MIKTFSLSQDKSKIKTLLNRNQFDFKKVNRDVKTILNTVKKKKDQALHTYSKKFDNVAIAEFKVSDQDIKDAFEMVSPSLIKIINEAKDNIVTYHKNQGFQPFEYNKNDDIILGQKVIPIDTVGLYIPGGTASYPSTVLMNAIPARVAGVKNIVMITPPNSDGTIKPAILVAAKLAGVSSIYKLGGAHGIAALAYGTETIPKVDKIVGPGNIYVSIAKKQLFGITGIDMIAGPSEILIIADAAANPDYIAADLMSQAEHDILASAILVTPCNDLAEKVKKALAKQIKTLSRQAIIEKSLKHYGAIIVSDNLEDAVRFSNQIAPEHLEILTDNPIRLLDDIKHAGSIFIAEYTPEAVGDYFAGPNHTLPTSGTARFSSPLSTSDFQKKSAYSYYSKNALKKASEAIITFADNEGLTAHSNAIKMRLEKDE